MKKALLLLGFFTAVVFTGCKFDDDDIWNELNEHSDRLATLEAQVKTLNSEIAAINTIVNAQKGSDWITGVVALSDGSGYSITFDKAGTITIKNGEKGDQGEKGEQGGQGGTGQNGSSPVIGVTEISGVYYWTLNGAVLKDNSGNNLPVSGPKGDAGNSGTPGTDAIAPQVRINSSSLEWEISIDGGTTWTSTGIVAQGTDGDSFFDSVDTIDTESVTFTLADGTTFTVPRYGTLGLTFPNMTSGSFEFSADGNGYYVEYIVTGAAAGIGIASPVPMGWNVTLDEANARIAVSSSVTGELKVLIVTTASDGASASYWITLNARPVPWDGVTLTQPASGTEKYNGYDYEVFYIGQASELAWLAEKTNNRSTVAEVRGKSAYFTQDIDMNDHQIEPIGYQVFGVNSESNLGVNEASFTLSPTFTGSVFGNGHTIYNVYLPNRDYTGRGLFAHIVGTGSSVPVVVDGLNIHSIQVNGSGKWSGGLIGYVRDVAQISNCSVENVFIATETDNAWTYACGALVGFISSTSEITISNCSTGNVEYGPIAWNSSGFIGKLYNNGKVTIENCQPVTGYCHTYLPVGETFYPVTEALYLGINGYNNSWFIGNITRGSNMELIINNVTNNSGNWTELTKNDGAGMDITANEQTAAWAWPYFTVEAGSGGTITVDGVSIP